MRVHRFLQGHERTLLAGPVAASFTTTLRSTRRRVVGPYERRG
jgi:hypothetical protein